MGLTLSPSVLTGCTGGGDGGGRGRTEQLPEVRQGSGRRAFGRETGVCGDGLRRPADVAMMQATDFGNRDDRAQLGRFDWPAVGGILVEREVSARAMVVREVRNQDASQMPLAKDDDVIEAVAPDGADEPLRERILPRRLRRRENFADAQALHAPPEPLAVDLVAIAEEVGRRGVVREGVHDLLGRPSGSGMLGDVEVENAPAVVGEHDEDEEHPQRDGDRRPA